MKPGTASITAQRVAAHRLTFEREPADFGDAAADGRLAQDVAGDFTVDDVAAGLRAAGHHRSVPTLFLCEGVAVYLELAVLESLLRALRARADDGSRLAISLSVDTGAPAVAARRAAFAEAVAAIGEPARTGLTVDDADALLSVTGWQMVDPSERARHAGLG